MCLTLLRVRVSPTTLKLLFLLFLYLCPPYSGLPTPASPLVSPRLFPIVYPHTSSHNQHVVGYLDESSDKLTIPQLLASSYYKNMPTFPLRIHDTSYTCINPRTDALRDAPSSPDTEASPFRSDSRVAALARPLLPSSLQTAQTLPILRSIAYPQPVLHETTLASRISPPPGAKPADDPENNAAIVQSADAYVHTPTRPSTSTLPPVPVSTHAHTTLHPAQANPFDIRVSTSGEPVIELDNSVYEGEDGVFIQRHNMDTRTNVNADTGMGTGLDTGAVPRLRGGRRHWFVSPIDALMAEVKVEVGARTETDVIGGNGSGSDRDTGSDGNIHAERTTMNTSTSVSSAPTDTSSLASVRSTLDALLRMYHIHPHAHSPLGCIRGTGVRVCPLQIVARGEEGMLDVVVGARLSASRTAPRSMWAMRGATDGPSTPTATSATATSPTSSSSRPAAANAGVPFITRPKSITDVATQSAARTRPLLERRHALPPTVILTYRETLPIEGAEREVKVEIEQKQEQDGTRRGQGDGGAAVKVVVGGVDGDVVAGTDSTIAASIDPRGLVSLNGGSSASVSSVGVSGNRGTVSASTGISVGTGMGDGDDTDEYLGLALGQEDVIITPAVKDAVVDTMDIPSLKTEEEKANMELGNAARGKVEPGPKETEAKREWVQVEDREANQRARWRRAVSSAWRRKHTNSDTKATATIAGRRTGGGIGGGSDIDAAVPVRVEVYAGEYLHRVAPSHTQRTRSSSAHPAKPSTGPLPASAPLSSSATAQTEGRSKPHEEIEKSSPTQTSGVIVPTDTVADTVVAHAEEREALVEKDTMTKQNDMDVLVKRKGEEGERREEEQEGSKEADSKERKTDAKAESKEDGELNAMKAQHNPRQRDGKAQVNKVDKMEDGSKAEAKTETEARAQRKARVEAEAEAEELEAVLVAYECINEAPESDIPVRVRHALTALKGRYPAWIQPLQAQSLSPAPQTSPTQTHTHAPAPASSLLASSTPITLPGDPTEAFLRQGVRHGMRHGIRVGTRTNGSGRDVWIEGALLRSEVGEEGWVNVEEGEEEEEEEEWGRKWNIVGTATAALHQAAHAHTSVHVRTNATSTSNASTGADNDGDVLHTRNHLPQEHAALSDAFLATVATTSAQLRNAATHSATAPVDSLLSHPVIVSAVLSALPSPTAIARASVLLPMPSTTSPASTSLYRILTPLACPAFTQAFHTLLSSISTHASTSSPMHTPALHALLSLAPPSPAALSSTSTTPAAPIQHLQVASVLWPLRHTCMIHKANGWWTYRICPHRDVVQFHVPPHSKHKPAFTSAHAQARPHSRGPASTPPATTATSAAPLPQAHVVVNGREVADLSLLPPDIRQMVEAIQAETLDMMRGDAAGAGGAGGVAAQLSRLAAMASEDSPDEQAHNNNPRDSGSGAGGAGGAGNGAGKAMSLLTHPADYVLGRTPTHTHTSLPALARTLNIVKTGTASDNYVMQEYINGSPCEVARNTPRYTQVRYYCDRDGVHARVLAVQELRPCVYAVDIGVPGLCALSLFTPPQRMLPETVCRVDPHAFSHTSPSPMRYHNLLTPEWPAAGPVGRLETPLIRGEKLNSVGLWRSAQMLGSRNIQAPGPEAGQWEALRKLV